jgi:hypothetical protein
VAGATSAGLTAAEPVRLVSQADAERAPAELALRVRLGGYSLRKRAGDAAQDIPRIREADGFRFDTAGLAAQLGRQRYTQSQLSFMSEVAAEPVTSALFAVAQTSQSLAVLLP